VTPPLETTEEVKNQIMDVDVDPSEYKKDEPKEEQKEEAKE